MKSNMMYRRARWVARIAKALRNRWLTYKYICMLNNAIEQEIKEFRNEDRG